MRELGTELQIPSFPMAALKDGTALNEKLDTADEEKWEAETTKQHSRSGSRSPLRHHSRSSSSSSSRGRVNHKRDARNSRSGNSRSCSRDRQSRSRSSSRKQYRESVERASKHVSSAPLKKHNHRSSHDSKGPSRHKDGKDDAHERHHAKRSHDKDPHRSGHKRRSRSRSRDRRRRSTSRDKRRSRSRSYEHRQSHSRDGKRSRSCSKDRKHSHSHEKSSRRRSRSRSYEPIRKRSLLSESKGIVKQALLLGGEVPAKALVGQMTPQLAVQQAMAAMSAKAQEMTGIALPKYYNPAAVNPLKYAEQMQKRKLLWNANKEKPEAATQATHSQNNWESTTFSQDQDGKMTAKFRKLMGIKEGSGDKMEEASGSEPKSDEGSPKATDELMRKQDELFRSLDQQYEIARMSTHTHRGVGLGFSSQGHHMFPK